MIKEQFVLFLFASFLVIKVGAQQTSPCFENADGEPIELFVVMTNPPVYGNGKADFSEYLSARLESIYKKQKGEIRLSLVINPEGRACLKDMSLTGDLNIPREKMQEIIAAMPTWQAGKQGGRAVYGSVRLRLKVADEQVYVLEGLPGKERKRSKKEVKRRKKEQEQKNAQSQFKDPFESFGYSIKEGDAYVATSLDKTPVYIEGALDFLTKLYSILKYPAEARSKSVQGTVYLQIDLNVFGQVTQALVRQGIGAGCDEASLNAFNAVSPLQFEPAIKDGKEVAVRFDIGVNFKLE